MAEVLHLAGEDNDLGAVEDGEALYAEADHVLTAADVLGRIEELVAEMVNTLSQGQLPSLELVSRSRKNTTYQAAASLDDEEANPGGDQVTKAKGVLGHHHPQQHVGNLLQVVALGARTQSRSLTANQGSSAFSYTRGMMLWQKKLALMCWHGCQGSQRPSQLLCKCSHPCASSSA